MDESLNDDIVDVDTLRSKCEEYLGGWKRANADYANLKKDTERQKTEILSYANERLLMEFLPAIDQFDTALRFLPKLENLTEDEKKQFDNWLLGLKAVRMVWDGVCKENGLEPLPLTDMFDPQIHEAVAHEDSTDIEEGKIVRTIHQGWKLKGKLLRPAKVVVAKKI